MKKRAIIFSVLILVWAFPVLANDRSLGCDRTALIGIGRSMLPTLPDGCRLAVVRIPLDRVHVSAVDGDVITTRLDGRVVTHRAIARLEDGSLVTQGDNNPQPDRIRTTAENYIGVVTLFEAPAGEVRPVPPRTL